MIKYEINADGNTALTGNISIEVLPVVNTTGSGKRFMFTLSEEMLKDIDSYDENELLAEMLKEDFLKLLNK